jgi:hypothetical protein
MGKKIEYKSFYIWKNKKGDFGLQTSGAIGSNNWDHYAILIRLESGENLRLELEDPDDALSKDWEWERMSEIKIPKKIEKYERETLDI